MAVLYDYVEKLGLVRDVLQNPEYCSHLLNALMGTGMHWRIKEWQQQDALDRTDYIQRIRVKGTLINGPKDTDLEALQNPPHPNLVEKFTLSVDFGMGMIHSVSIFGGHAAQMRPRTTDFDLTFRLGNELIKCLDEMFEVLAFRKAVATDY